MTNGLLCLLRAGCMVILSVAPWLFTTGPFAHARVEWQCDTPFELLRFSPQAQESRVLGLLSQFYHGDGRGLARLNGRLETLDQNQTPQRQTFHRVAEFVYGPAGPYFKKRIDQVSQGMGDTMPAQWALEYFHEPGSDYYLQVMRLGGQGRALGAIGMPRLYCSDP
ncbi:hypothetical protein [Pseudomonas sp. RIT-PI-S]|uniref:hypothetical protein n=1 Tax=Pseudomonas sp. RIT-PI-S TaxID=3035295 RepID=UPI0021D8815D|nr:hypothetical protein [Pseudomonas sp. RIT-PI-S]